MCNPNKQTRPHVKRNDRRTGKEEHVPTLPLCARAVAGPSQLNLFPHIYSITARPDGVYLLQSHPLLWSASSYFWSMSSVTVLFFECSAIVSQKPTKIKKINDFDYNTNKLIVFY